ncbi:ABC transporter ATP-binding protein [Actinosynnema sp. NPDC050436]|uniref:ABC transporter ATP-binding protein n=1 Tax=Actinosynnema sp. NPDC050436 TaxID=3155659 RepID=UPI0033C82900
MTTAIAVDKRPRAVGHVERNGGDAVRSLLERIGRREEWQFFTVLPKAHKPLAAAWWALVVLRGVLPAIFAVAVGWLVGVVTAGGPLTGPLVVLGVVFVVMQVLAPVHSQVGANLGDRLASWMNDRLLAATVEPAGMAHLESPELTDDLTTARDFELGLSGPPMSLSLGFIAGGLVQLATGVGQVLVIGAYHWWAALLVGTAWASTHWLLRNSTVWDRTTGEAQQAQRHAAYAYGLAVEAPPAKEIRLFGIAGWVVSRFTRHRRTLVELRRRATRLRRGPLLAAVVLLVAVNGSFFWLLAADAATGALGPGQVAVYAQAAVGASALAFGGLNWALPLAAGATAALLRVERGMAEVGELPGGGRAADGLPVDGLRLRDVSFRYASGGPAVLDGVDLTIPAGSSLAVVGVNGAGKTTLVKLLCRLYDPTGGAVEADGVDLREFDPAAWRRRVTAVFQDFIRYELPLRDNVAPHGATGAEITSALALAGADGLADLDAVLAAGYDGGTDLSGGQWQRVALARVLCAVERGAGVVVLDEPTAQLDVRGETEVFDRVLDATRGCTTVLISHRFSTVRRADRICVLEHGRVAELGTHDELMALGGRYRTLFDLQAHRFGEEEPDAVALV